MGGVESVVAISELLKRVAACTRMIDAVDLLLDAREIARAAIASSAEPRDETTRFYRLWFAYSEIAITDFIRAQPEATPEQEQQLMDAIVAPINVLSARSAQSSMET